MKKIKLLTASASVATVAGVVLPLASCVSNKATNEYIEIEGPTQIRMHHGQGGEATFRAVKGAGRMDISNSIKWDVSIHDSSISIEGGHLKWTAEFTRKWSAINYIYVSGEFQGRKIRGYHVDIDWFDQDLRIKYEGPTSWSIDENAPYLITDTTALQVIRNGRILDRKEYTAKIVNVVTSCKDGDLTLNNDGSIQVGSWKLDETGGVKGISFGIEIKLVEDETIFTAMDNFWIGIQQCDLDIDITDQSRIEVFVGTAGESKSQYVITKNGKDITNDENVTDIGIWADMEFGDDEPFTSLTYNRVTKKITWKEDFEDIKGLYGGRIYIKYTYTNPVTHQVHIVKDGRSDLICLPIKVEVDGDEEGFDIDECSEFSDFTWTKNVYYQKNDNPEEKKSPTPLDIKYLTVTPQKAEDFGKYPEGVSVSAEQINEDKIKIIPHFGHNLIAGEYAFYIHFDYNGPGLIDGTSHLFTLNVTQKSIEPEGYSTSLAGQELEDGSDKKQWNVKYDTFEGTKNVADKCKYTLVNDGSTEIPENAIYVDKSDGKAVTKWKKELNPGNYKFHFDLEYEYNSQKYYASSETIDLTIGLAKLVIISAPTSISATEWVSDTDSNEMRAELQWEDGKTEDVSANATWSIVGSDKAKNCFSVVPDESKSHWSIHWKNNINKETVPSDENIKVKVDLTIGSKVYEAAISDGISVNMEEDSLSMNGGSTKITANTNKPDEDKTKWECSLQHGSITSDDKLEYSIIDLSSDELKGKVKIDGKGLVSWEKGIKPTTTDKPYTFKVKAVLHKQGRDKAYEVCSKPISMLVSDETQTLFEQMSWSDLITTINSDNGLDKLRKIIWLDEGKGFEGLTKTIQLNVDGQKRTYTTRVIGSNHDTISETSKKAPLTFEIMELTYSGAPFSENDNNCWYDGKNSCLLRTKLNDMAKDMFPSEVYNNIKQVNKVCATADIKDGEHVTVTSKDKIWLPSATELGANRVAQGFIWADEGTPYKFYENVEPILPEKRTKYLWNEDREQIIKGIYWTRSPSDPRHGAASVCAIYGNGWLDSMDVSDANQFISICFCL